VAVCNCSPFNGIHSRNGRRRLTFRKYRPGNVSGPVEMGPPFQITPASQKGGSPIHPIRSDFNVAGHRAGIFIWRFPMTDFNEQPLPERSTLNRNAKHTEYFGGGEWRKVESPDGVVCYVNRMWGKEPVRKAT
jgi:hypothetical protein